MHDCDVTPRVVSESPSVDSDPALRGLVSEVARGTDGVHELLETAGVGVIEDVTYLMESVQGTGSLASYMLVGTDHPTNHQTPTFDIDRESLAIGVSVLAQAVCECTPRRP